MRLALHWQILIGMAIGAVIGLVLNATQGAYEWSSVEGDKLPAGVVEASVIDTPDLITIRWETADGPTQTAVVDGSRQAEGSVASLGDLKKKQPVAYAIFQTHGRSTARVVGDFCQRLGGLFLRLLKMVALPLIVSSLISGVMGLGDASRLGRMFGRTIAYYLSTSMLAICTGLLMVNTIRPGLRSDQASSGGAADEGIVGDQDIGEVLMQQVETAIPPNPFEALASAEFLSVISFSIAFAVFALLQGGQVAEKVKSAADTAFQVMMRMTMAIIRLAPIGVLFLMVYVTATQGPAVFKLLAWYMLAVLLALMLHALVTLPLILRFVAGRNPLEFARAMSPALLTAFSSASSNGTLPLTMASVENRAGVDNKVSSFVLPLGATINMDGTALYEAVAVLFIAQMYYGENPSLTTQILVAVTALLASIGAAGIPHAGLVMMVIVLQVVGLPAEMQGVVLAVDRVLDMCRTSVNVWSDSCGCAVVARFEGDGAGKTEAAAPAVS